MSDKTTDENRETTDANDSVDMPIEDTGIKIVETPEKLEEPELEKADKDTLAERPRRGFPWFGVFNFLLILGLIAAAGYFWQLQQKTEAEKQAAFDTLKKQIASKAESSQIESGLQPLESGLAEITQRIAGLQQQQKDLQGSSEQLYELFGRDQNGWQLAEVEYLMRIAQHKLILENDFEGAALTLQAASDRIASTGDLGLLPVRVKISDEIAELKTRTRADLVGMTLKLSQLAQQIRSLRPGFQPRTDAPFKTEPETALVPEADFMDQAKSLLGSLVSVKRETDLPPTQTEALVINVGETLEDNLKLTRWSVLERDAIQYRRLMKENIELFRQYYNLDNAANHDFLSQLEALQKAEIKPEKPDIMGSLEMLRKIISKRDNAAEQPIGEDGDNV
ncbi:MAG: hypothetical protein GY763_15220 [Gammaproteobacteria bacterium]|nr:hypothetical protein [Gammaproteobacteria bacterium]